MAYYDDLTNGNFVSAIRKKAVIDQFGQQQSPTYPDASVGGQLFPDTGTITDHTYPSQGELPIDSVNPEATSTYGRRASNTDRLAEIMDIVDKKYHPEHASTDRLNAFLDQFPQQDNYKPSFARRLVSIGVGMGKGGIEAQNKVLDAPYTDELAAWKERAAPFQSAATLENQQNINERQLMTSLATNEVNQNRYDQQNTIAEEKNRIADLRARAYAAKNNGWTVEKAGSRYIAVHPETGERRDLGASGGVDRETELDIMGQWSVKAQQARGEAAVKEAQAAGKGLVVIDNKTYEPDGAGGYKPVQGLPSGTPTRPGTPQKPPAPETAANASKRRVNTIQELWDTGDPYDKAWLEKGDNNVITVKDLPTNASPGDVFARNQVLHKLYPEHYPDLGKDIALPSEDVGAPAPSPSQNVPAPAPTAGRTGGPPPATSGGGGQLTYEQQMAGVNDGTRIIAIDPQGKRVTIANNQAAIEEAVRKHYKVQVKKP